MYWAGGSLTSISCDLSIFFRHNQCKSLPSSPNRAFVVHYFQNLFVHVFCFPSNTRFHIHPVEWKHGLLWLLNVTEQTEAKCFFSRLHVTVSKLSFLTRGKKVESNTNSHGGACPFLKWKIKKMITLFTDQTEQHEH